MAVGVRITQRVWWGGDAWFNNDLMPALRRATMEASTMYAVEVRKRYSLQTGSVPSKIPGMKIRVKHSRPGQPPFIQTGNLSLSVRQSANFGKTVLKSRISTDVPYATTLEFGGSLSVSADRKKYTSVRILNPLKITPFIAPRPVWRPVWNDMNRKMLDHIVSTARAI